MRIPFFRAQGAGNDFLFSWRDDLVGVADLPAMARAICHRNFGVGGDGWYVMSKPAAASAGTVDAAIHLYNSDGSQAELSGNGTRCAAAVLMDIGLVAGEVVRIETGAGLRELRLMGRAGAEYQFEMAMGCPVVEAIHLALPVDGKTVDCTLVDVGNPQCAVELSGLGYTSFDSGWLGQWNDWRTLGAAIEAHPYFPHRSNVSFFSRIDSNAIAARFFERGAGATLSSGTGATGAATAARALGLVESPVTVETEAGDLKIRWVNDDVFLAGPAKVIARGEYYAS